MMSERDTVWAEAWACCDEPAILAATAAYDVLYDAEDEGGSDEGALVMLS